MSLAADGDPMARKLRILLIAYEFPPSASAQSLRWAYLAGRLAKLGHEVHVMAPAIAGNAVGLPALGAQVETHRVWPGPMLSLIGWLEHGRSAPSRGRFAAPGTTGDVRPPRAPRPAVPPTLNWKGRLLKKCLRMIGWIVFPDVRGEWYLPGRLALRRLLGTMRPDIVVSSHEPATTLKLGLYAKQMGFLWVADIADPVLAPYTSRRWRRHAHELEARVMREADHVLVTTQSALELLGERHGSGAPVSVITQGFDEQFAASRMPKNRDSALQLLYSGSFYSFRDPKALIEAVLDVPGVSLSIASRSVPDWLIACADEFPDKVILLGSMHHRRLLLLQRQMDILVNLGNADPCQVPGKLYEYFGAGRPILHLSIAASDASGDLLRALKRGWTCPGDHVQLVRALRALIEAQREGRLEEGLDLTPGRVQPWAWTAIGRQVEGVLLRTVDTGS